jgi:hypothetical protein
MMYRSIEYSHGPMHLQSSANASWGKPLSPCPALNETSSPKPSICVNRLLQHLRRDHRQLLGDESSLKRKKRLTPQKKNLVDDIKMDRLLQMLRTNEFVGIIDSKPHSHYLSEELLQESSKKCMVNEVITRRSFAYGSTRRESSHFKTALKKAKSTPAVATY